MGYMPYYYFNQNSSFGTEAELRSLITKFKAAGIGAIADVVINHRNTEGWYTFPAETYKGVTYQMQSTDICKNDDGGTTATQAATNGVSLSNNNDEGEDWDGCRDLDHKSANVQKIIKAYLKYLKDDLGYTGFRYDMVKGFDGSHVADYNDATGVEYSVGEYWDGNDKIESWINRTNKKSAAFDFQFRYNVRDAIGVRDNKIVAAPNWTKLNSEYNLMHDKIIVATPLLSSRIMIPSIALPIHRLDPLKGILLQQMHICLLCQEHLVSSSHTGEITSRS